MITRNHVTAGAVIVAAGGVGGGLSFIHPLAPFAGVVGLVLAYAVLRSAFVSLLAFIVVLFSRPADFFPQLAVLQPAKVLVLASLAVFALSKVLRRDASYVRAPQTFILGVLTVVVFASSILGSSPGESLALANDVFLKIVLLYVLVIHLADSMERAMALQVTIGAMSAALGSWALYAKLTGQATVEGSRAAFVGLLGDPNDLALTILMATPFLISASFRVEGRSRWAFRFMALAAVLGIVSTLSRGGLLGLGSALYLLLRSFGVSRLKVLSGIGTFGVIVLLASGLTSRQSGAVGAGEIDESAQGRLDAWAAGGRMVLRHPGLGVGFGRFADNFDAYAVNSVFWGRHETHNSYIKAASETGLFGLAAFMALILTSARTAFSLHRRSREVRGSQRALLEGALPNLAGFLVSAFFLSQCWGWFLYVLVAQIVATDRASREVEV